MSWQANKAWSDRFVPQIKNILGTHLIQVAEPDDDTLRNTDLLTLQLPGQVRIACRVRRHEYLRRYPDEFTLRASVPSGRQTEIDKLLAGWGDFLFYGFATADESDLAAWFIGDLQVFRQWVANYRRQHGDWPGELRGNRDNSSLFMAFSLLDVDDKFVVARQRAEHPPALPVSVA